MSNDIKDEAKEIETNLLQSMQEFHKTLVMKNKIFPLLINFIIRNKLDEYCKTNQVSLAETLFEACRNEREINKGSDETHTIRCSEREIDFNYIFKSLIEVRRFVRNEKEAIFFLEECLNKIKNGEFERFL